MRPRKVVVFTGPTLLPESVTAVLPHAQVRPPAGRGDLLEVDWRPGDAAVIIDGYFRERRSIGHKEVLWLLHEGVDVLGAASMGALRAAELAPFGMRGIGEVYRMYTSDEIDGDDEVGVLHGPAERGYPALTVALVNLRHGCRHTDLIPEPTGRRIVAAAKALPFTHRTWDDLARGLSEDDHAALRLLQQRIASGEWDLKRLDALAALHAVDAATTPTASYPIDIAALTGISHNRKLRHQSTREYAPGRSMSDLDALDAARLFDEHYPATHEHVLSGLLTDIAAARDLTVEEYAHAKLGVDGRSALPDTLACWLTDAESASLAPDQQLRLLMMRVWPVWQSVDWRPAVLAHLRERASWSTWSDLVAHADVVAEQTCHRIVVPPPLLCGTLFLRHWQRPGTSSDVEMARRGFSSLEELGHAVQRFFAYDLQRTRTAVTASR